ncbi:pimeloyl-CoA dehydrogenase small subunit [Parahaliea maris]|uniref:Pimeloyl-CoA dehydrogenase small subunit n=1 Tax=Parahaliea maris TaxID=2716870 RepID=A0A5C9A3E9_9GAMM|nr:acyl-CoA dehydrogenase family protein [Parahaliea maris]TXS95288.1 pimeloyl-CoA dehydrogenase small subunit [Parahaliea maris]
MNFEFNEEQKLLQHSVEAFLRDNYDFQRRQQQVESDTPFDQDLWRQCAELGWLGLPFSEEDGGLGASAVEMMIVFEQLGRYLVIEPFFETLVLFGGALKRSRHPIRSECLQQLISGQLHGALAHFELHSRGEIGSIESVSTTTDDGFCLKGCKTTVYNAPEADFVIVSALNLVRGEELLQLFLLPANKPGLEIEAYQTTDGRHAAELHLNNVHVDASCLLAEGSEALAILRETYDDALLLLCAEHQGAMEQLLRETVEYASERKQFGQAIGSFQVLQHRMVDMYIATELARSLLYAATLKSVDQSPDAGLFIAAAKVKSDTCAKAVAESAVQIHGGIATTNELSIGHYLKRIIVVSHLFGSTQYHQRRFGKLSRQLFAPGGMA